MMVLQFSKIPHLTFLLVVLLWRLRLSEAKVRIFLLAGQSNAVGWAEAHHLRSLAQEPESNYGFIIEEESGDFRSRSDVKVMYNQAPGEPGNLTVGYGNMPTETYFGPELGLGWTLGPASKDPILIVKVGVGGSGLGISWLPPSAGEPSGARGALFALLVDMTWEAAMNVGDIFPGETEFEISGFVWFQGWFDAFIETYRLNYFANLIYFINDLRAEFDLPNLPVIIGELGQEGLEQSQITELADMRVIQKAVATVMGPQVVFVPTWPYVVLGEEVFDGIGHYYGRADTMMDIGEAFGKAMLELVDLEPISFPTSSPSSPPVLVTPTPAPVILHIPSGSPIPSKSPEEIRSPSLVPASSPSIAMSPFRPSSPPGPSGSFSPSLLPSGSFLPSQEPSNVKNSFLPSFLPSPAAPSDCADELQPCTSSDQCCNGMICFRYSGQALCVALSSPTPQSSPSGGFGNEERESKSAATASKFK